MEKSDDTNLSKSTIQDPDKQLNPNEPLIISPEGKLYLINTAKWANFIAIVGFVMVILMVLSGIAILSISPVANEYQDFQSLQYYPFSLLVMGISNILIALILFFPTLYLYKFSKKIKLGMSFDNQMHLNEGLKNLKNMFQFSGILTIISLAIMLISIPVMIFSIGMLNTFR